MNWRGVGCDRLPHGPGHLLPKVYARGRLLHLGKRGTITVTDTPSENPVDTIFNAGNPGAFLTAIADATSVSEHIGQHTRTDCPDPEEHRDQADRMAIQKCASNREENDDARYCVSAYCPRCTEMRNFYGDPAVVPNSWLIELDRMETDKAEQEQLRADSLALLVNMHSTHFAPDLRSDEGPGEIDEMLGMAESLRAVREELNGNACNHDPEIVWRAMFEASRLVYPTRRAMRSNFLQISHKFAHYLAGEYEFAVSTEEDK